MAGSWRTVYLSLGSNTGDRRRNLQRAVAALLAAGLRRLRCSSLYETQPVGGPPQRFFLNAVVEAQTCLMPLSLLQHLKGIERALGRRPECHWGPRPMDIDILFYGRLRIRHPQLRIPHPELPRRSFVLLGLHELTPFWRDPATSRSIRELLGRASGLGLVRRVEGPEWCSGGLDIANKKRI
jgi:2-amino-4-hydroxy-6-hydroxymethyldihydropteridine diphosphokinase